ncbi:MAG: Adenylosuccinate synthetase [Chlamydiae bacterium]|nr:Adenylosuccinate synthetase [Chlamydiota bacterium]
MPGIIVVGLQWGDEGKGKIVDLLSTRSSHIVRSQGGNNAGHTVKTASGEFALHLVPSGILHAHAHCYIGSGCFIDPKALVEEMKMIESRGVPIMQRLHLSAGAHLIFPFHRELDRLYEEIKGKGAVGTTGRGIGPCASDRAARVGIRIAELIRPDIFRGKLEQLALLKNLELEKIFSKAPIDIDAVYAEYATYGELLLPFVADVEGRIQESLIRGETVLFEGAHGTLLDTLFGSYPYVTSSSTISSGVLAGAGVSPGQVDEVVGVLKAYTTRVGGGPLPTTLDPDSLSSFQQADDFREIGTTTGRVRRIGWLDLVLARHAISLNGVGNLVLTKLDVLDNLEEIKVCIGYSLNGEKIDKPPPLIEDFEQVEPIYETLPGWQMSTKGARNIRDLPKSARQFIDYIEDYCNVSISMISVGPGRDETIQIDEEWV